MAPHRRRRGPLVLLTVCVLTLLAASFGAEVVVMANMRDTTLRSARADLSNIAVALAEQAKRSLDSVDMALTGLADRMTAGGHADPAAFAQRLATEAWQERLSSAAAGLPHVDALMVVGTDGRLLNISTYWPPPGTDFSDQAVFRALSAPSHPLHAIDGPARNRASGNWSMTLARRVQTRDGVFLGIVVASVSLGYFDDFYRSVSSGAAWELSLVRHDGTVLAGYPGGRQSGAPDTDLVRWIADSFAESTDELRAWQRVTDYPLTLIATQPRAVALHDWEEMAWLVTVISVGGLCWVLIAVVAVGRWWIQQQELVRERAERAELDQGRLAAEADLAREREHSAEAESRAKSGFLATMSHEIRTPMNGVLGLASSLLDEPLAPQHRKVVEAIRDAGDALLRILNDILDFSKLDAGRMTFEDIAFSPATLTHGVVSILGPRARAKGLQITVACDAGVPAALLGDAGRIRQVLLNLVSNAVKFTEQGAVDISARLIGHGNDSATLEWVVRDTGIGIAPDRVGSLFGEFVQADHSIARRFGGSGMGLAISKRLIEQMGGTVTVASEPGKGTQFHIRLTLPVVDEVETKDNHDADVISAFVAHLSVLGRPLRILFAEDNPTNQFVALQILKGFNVQVDVAADGLEAVDAATTFLYDVICMDMQMPEMDGLAATKLLRRRGGRLAEIPVIALTANTFPEDVKACLDAGMNMFVAKPVRKEALIAALLSAMGASVPAVPTSRRQRPDARTAIATSTQVNLRPDGGTDPTRAGSVRVDAGRARGERAEHTARGAAGAGQREVAVVDGVALANLMEVIGPEGIDEMMHLFEAETHARLHRLADPNRDRAADGRELHTLKGAARTVCAAQLAAVADGIEARLHDGDALSPADLEAVGSAYEVWRQAAAANRPDVQHAA